MKLEGVVIVTGAASGIGRASAEHFAALGATVVAADVDAAGLDALKGDGIVKAAGDLSRNADCVRIAETAAQAGRVTGLFNCAGIERHGSVVDMPEEDWDQVIAVNLKAIFLLSKHVIPLMQAGGGGAIVNMSSVHAHATGAREAAYAAAKGGVISMTRAMALDHGAENIRVVAVCPGTIDTPLVRKNVVSLRPGDPDGLLREWEGMHALKRAGRPIEIAKAVAFLLSDDASFITGSFHLLDGGLLASI